MHSASNPQESKWVSPKKMIAGLKAQGEKLQSQMESIQTTIGLISNLEPAVIGNKKFQEVLKSSKKVMEEWNGFKESISKHIE